MHNAVQMNLKLISFVFSAELLVNWLHSLHQTRVIIWIFFHICKLVLVVLRVIVQSLTQPYKLGQHVELACVLEFEVLLLIAE